MHSIMADNASNNDTMVDELSTLLHDFPGKANHTHCFLHIVNLVAKQLLKQFDIPQKNVDSALDEAEQQLLKLAAGIDIEELVTSAKQGAGLGSEGNDDIDGWVNEMDELDLDERNELEKSVQPIRLVLMKVSINI
jgi:hypothetical protein